MKSENHQVLIAAVSKIVAIVLVAVFAIVSFFEVALLFGYAFAVRYAGDLMLLGAILWLVATFILMASVFSVEPSQRISPAMLRVHFVVCIICTSLSFFGLEFTNLEKVALFLNAIVSVWWLIKIALLKFDDKKNL